MDLRKIETILRARTFDLFGDKWYKKTSIIIVDSFTMDTKEEIDAEKANYFEWFSNNLAIGEMHDSKAVYFELNANISQKMMTMMIKSYAEFKDLKYNSIRTHNARNFILNYK